MNLHLLAASIVALVGNMPAGVRPEFLIDSGAAVEHIPQVRSIESSGLRVHRSGDVGRFYDVAGHRSLLVGDEGMWFEVWAYPLKTFHNCELGVVVDGAIVWGETIKKSFTVTPEASTITYEAAGVSISQTIFAPIDEPGIVMLIESKSEKPVTVVMKLQDDLRLMWPAEGLGADTERGIDSKTGAWVVRSKERRQAAMAGWSSGPSDIDLPADPKLEKSIAVSCEIRAGEARAFVFAASLDGVDEARNAWLRLAEDPYELLQGTADYYRRLDKETLSVSLPDAKLNEAYRWAKVGLDKCYKVSEGTGAGYVAGFHGSWGNARPGFGWYFGRDSSWCQYAAAAYGQFDKSRANTELLAKYQIADGPDKGKIYHEISAAHGQIPDESWRRGYAYFAADATPFFVIDVADYMRWSGDTGFVRKNWQHVLDALGWCYRMDVDGELMIDNPPAGHQWYDGGEKNMIDLVAIWCKALECAAEMGEIVGDANVAKWRADARAIRRTLNTDFWDQSRGYLYDRKLPDGTMNALTTANPTVPLLWNMIEPEKADRAIDRISQPDMTVPWGLRTNSNRDDIYNHQGYHAGTVWPLVTGWGAMAAFNNHRTDAGLHYLKANADLTWDFTSGYITEVVDGDSKIPIGCPHQGWSEAMVVLPLVDGLLGIRVDAVKKTISFAPHIPQDWKNVQVTNLKAGDSSFNIRYERENDKTSISLERCAGTSPYRITVLPAFAKTIDGVAVSVNGSPASAEITRTPSDSHASVSATIQNKLKFIFKERVK